jgi:hypothetical protein
MGIGMGALIAGLFGMNVSVLCSPTYVVLPTYGPAFSLPVTWKSSRTPLWVCPLHRVSLHFSLHGVVFESPFFDYNKSILLCLMDIIPLLGWQRSKKSGYRHLTAGKAPVASPSLCGKSVRKTGHDIFHHSTATNLDTITRVRPCIYIPTSMHN